MANAFFPDLLPTTWFYSAFGLGITFLILYVHRAWMTRGIPWTLAHARGKKFALLISRDNDTIDAVIPQYNNQIARVHKGKISESYAVLANTVMKCGGDVNIAIAHEWVGMTAPVNVYAFADICKRLGITDTRELKQYVEFQKLEQKITVDGSLETPELALIGPPPSLLERVGRVGEDNPDYNEQKGYAIYLNGVSGFLRDTLRFAKASLLDDTIEHAVADRLGDDKRFIMKLAGVGVFLAVVIVGAALAFTMISRSGPTPAPVAPAKVIELLRAYW